MLTGGLADKPSPAVFSVIYVFLSFFCVFYFHFLDILLLCPCAFHFLIGATLFTFTLTITELDEGQS